jgi:hypothetical protein
MTSPSYIRSLSVTRSESNTIGFGEWATSNSSNSLSESSSVTVISSSVYSLLPTIFEIYADLSENPTNYGHLIITITSYSILKKFSGFLPLMINAYSSDPSKSFFGIGVNVSFDVLHTFGWQKSFAGMGTDISC